MPPVALGMADGGLLAGPLRWAGGSSLSAGAPGLSLGSLDILGIPQELALQAVRKWVRPRLWLRSLERPHTSRPPVLSCNCFPHRLWRWGPLHRRVGCGSMCGPWRAQRMLLPPMLRLSWVPGGRVVDRTLLSGGTERRVDPSVCPHGSGSWGRPLPCQFPGPSQEVGTSSNHPGCCLGRSGPRSRSW